MESNVSAELIQARKRAISEWNAWRARTRQEMAQNVKSRRNARRKDEEQEEAVELIDELLEESVTTLD